MGIGVTSIYSPKAKKWIEGRRNWEKTIAATLQDNEKRIWIHCSSLGEFEQGRPLLELIRREYPAYKIVLTFFSPSGYEACKTYDKADYIFYLPMDAPAAARVFVAAVNPLLVIFVKYEFWHYFLNEIHSQKIPLLLVSATFREQQAFFKWYGGFFSNMLRFFSHIHVQDAGSAGLLKLIGIADNVSVTGDTRYDRVLAISAQLRAIPVAEHFKGNAKILIAGSTWPADEIVLKEYLQHLPNDWKIILAPHEIDERHIKQLQQLFGNDALLYSVLAAGGTLTNERVLIVDNIGMLSSLYAYGDVAWVGGGFAKSGIHNTLEPAIFGLPIVMGPVYQKFVEAVELVAAGSAFSVKNEAEAIKTLSTLTSDAAQRKEIKNKTHLFMQQHTGATARILKQINTSGWL